MMTRADTDRGVDYKTAPQKLIHTSMVGTRQIRVYSSHYRNHS